MKFKLEKDKKLFWLNDLIWVEVELKSCFPESNPNKFLSLQNNKGEELLMIETLGQFDDIDQKTLKEYLEFKRFKFEIIGIHSIEEDFGLRHFEVKTQKGDRSFQMPLDEWPKVTKDGRVLINDIYGEQYVVGNLEFGQKHLSAYV